MPSLKNKFWLTKDITELNNDEWEALCDRCGKCCLHKLEDSDTQQVIYTNVACKLLNVSNGSCSKYDQRHSLVHDCIKVTPQNIASIKYWLPLSCAYRCIYEKRDIPDWHPLKKNNPNSTLISGNSVALKVIHEYDDIDLEEYITEEFSS